MQQDLSQIFQVKLYGFVVAVGDIVGFGKDCSAAFHIEKSGRSFEFEAELLRIEQVKDRHIVLAKMQVLKALFQQRRFNKQVGQHDDQRTLPNGLGEFVQNGHQFGFAFWLG